MSDWKIVIVVSGKKLDTTLAMVHTLKPKSLDIIPIASGPPGNGATINARIKTVLEHDHKKVWQAKELAEKIGASTNTVSTALANLYNKKTIKRVSSGKYRGLNNG